MKEKQMFIFPRLILHSDQRVFGKRVAHLTKTRRCARSIRFTVRSGSLLPNIIFAFAFSSSESSRRSAPRIENLPAYHTFTEYTPNEINCEVSGNPTPDVTWTRVNGQVSNEVRVEGSRLIFERPRKSDEGRYRCQAYNGEGPPVEQYTHVYIDVAPATPPPPMREEVFIEPPSYSGEAGQSVRLTCNPISNIILKYEWTKDGYPIYRQHNLIINNNMLEIREASPRDSGTYTCIGIDIRGRHNYTSDAVVIIEDIRGPHVVG